MRHKLLRNLQGYNNECGLFVAEYAERFLMNKQIKFSTKDLDKIRTKIARTIYKINQPPKPKPKLAPHPKPKPQNDLHKMIFTHFVRACWKLSKNEYTAAKWRGLLTDR